MVICKLLICYLSIAQVTHRKWKWNPHRCYHEQSLPEASLQNLVRKSAYNFSEDKCNNETKRSLRNWQYWSLFGQPKKPPSAVKAELRGRDQALPRELGVFSSVWWQSSSAYAFVSFGELWLVQCLLAV